MMHVYRGHYEAGNFGKQFVGTKPLPKVNPSLHSVRPISEKDVVCVPDKCGTKPGTKTAALCLSSLIR